jgi:hypothetical protein
MLARVKYWLDQLDRLSDKGFPDKRASSMLSLSWESSITVSALMVAFWIVKLVDRIDRTRKRSRHADIRSLLHQLKL